MPLNAVILRIQPSGMRVDRRGPVRTVSMLRTTTLESPFMHQMLHDFLHRRLFKENGPLNFKNFQQLSAPKEILDIEPEG